MDGCPVFCRTFFVAGKDLPNIYDFTSFQACNKGVENAVILVLDTRKHLVHVSGWHANLRVLL